MSLFSPKISVLSTWQSTFAVMMQTFRRVKFVIEETFQFGDFDSQAVGVNIVGPLVVNRARFLKIFKFLWISLDLRFDATVVGGTNSVLITIPYNLASAGSASQQGGACLSIVEGLPNVPTPICWYNDLSQGANKIRLEAPTLAFTLVPTRLALNAFMETV